MSVEQNNDYNPDDSAALLMNALNGDTVDFDVDGTTADTPKTTESSDTPNATAEKAEQSKPDDTLTADNAVILAKDGIHTISYDVLQQARESERLAKAQAAQAAAEAAQAQAALEQLKQQLQHSPRQTQQQNIAIAQNAIDQGVDPAIFGDFDEEGIANGIKTILAQQKALLEKEFDQKLQQALSPVAQKQQQDEIVAHLSAIKAAHPDVESIAESQQFANWIGSQPSYAQDAIRHVAAQGTTQQVIELLSSFKNATAKPATTDIKQAAQQQINHARATVPASLSDMQGGRAADSNTPEERVANASPVAMLGAMQDWSVDDINNFLDKGL